MIHKNRPLYSNNVTPSTHDTYDKVINYLDKKWKSLSKSNFLALDKALGNLSQQIFPIIISGTSGKTLTAYYLAKRLMAEGIIVASYVGPHTIQYNERIKLNNTTISHDQFTNAAQKVFQVIKQEKIKAQSEDILTTMALLYAIEQKASVIILEQHDISEQDPIFHIKPTIFGITRIVAPEKDSIQSINTLSKQISANTHVVSADQNKNHLRLLAKTTNEQGGNWVMPIRKVAQLPYPFEQLHGRCAALAERVTQVYLEKQALTRTKYPFAQQSQDFWSQNHSVPPFHFDLHIEKGFHILLDNAHNADAFENLLLGIRLLHYKNPYKHISLVMSTPDISQDLTLYIKYLNYFTKHIPCSIVICSTNPLYEYKNIAQHNPHTLIELAQAAKIKISWYPSFTAAYKQVTAVQYKQEELFVFTGSQTILTEYMEYKKYESSL